MKHCLKLFFALLATITFATTPIQASDEKKVIIEVETDSFKLAATDVSSLAVGESKTIETESGKVVDILRTLDEFEIYVDGELLDLGLHHDPDSEMHVISNHVEVFCDEDDEDQCGKHIFIHTRDAEGLTTWITEGDEDVFVHKNIEITCSDDPEDGEEVNCKHFMIMTAGDGQVDIESMHEAHEDGEGRKVIVITSKMESND